MIKVLLTEYVAIHVWHHGSTLLLGIDFQMRTLTLGSTIITLQLWDTAGQERSDVSQFIHMFTGLFLWPFIIDIPSDSIAFFFFRCNDSFFFFSFLNPV